MHIYNIIIWFDLRGLYKLINSSYKFISGPSLCFAYFPFFFVVLFLYVYIYKTVCKGAKVVHPKKGPLLKLCFSKKRCHFYFCLVYDLERQTEKMEKEEKQWIKQMPRKSLFYGVGKVDFPPQMVVF